MAYRGISHVAVRVNNLREAERFYSRLFGLAVAFWEAETSDGWRTLPEDASWDDAQAAGIPPVHDDIRAESHGARLDRWLDLAARAPS